MIGFRVVAALAGAVALTIGLHSGAPLAAATPEGDAYTLAGNNFPTTFGPSGPLTFNALGDTTPETVPGVGLTVVEGFGAGLGAHGGDLLGFQFTLTSGPADGTLPFGFLIGDIDYSNGLPLSVLGAQIAFDFGFGSTPLIDAAAFTTIASGLDVTFISPVSWATLFAATSPPPDSVPTEFVVTFLLEVSQQVPEPSTLLLLALALVGMPFAARSGSKSGPAHRPLDA